MADKLKRLGVPEGEIAFIQDYDADNAKLALFRSVREGKVRVLFGSTQKMGSGTNVQDRLVALHHLDAPWRPADVEQREGRILRQGNRNASVQIYRYVTEGSFDAYMWQTLETKAKFIAQVMSGDMTVRRLEDMDSAALTYAEVKAIASGNPLVIEKAQVDAELIRLNRLRSAHAGSSCCWSSWVRRWACPSLWRSCRCWFASLTSSDCGRASRPVTTATYLNMPSTAAASVPKFIVPASIHFYEIRKITSRIRQTTIHRVR